MPRVVWLPLRQGARHSAHERGKWWRGAEAVATGLVPLHHEHIGAPLLNGELRLLLRVGRDEEERLRTELSCAPLHIRAPLAHVQLLAEREPNGLRLVLQDAVDGVECLGGRGVGRGVGTGKHAVVVLSELPGKQIDAQRGVGAAEDGLGLAHLGLDRRTI